MERVSLLTEFSECVLQGLEEKRRMARFEDEGRTNPHCHLPRSTYIESCDERTI